MKDTNRSGRGWLPVVTAFVAAMLMAPVAGAPAAESSPRSQSPCTQANCVFVLDKGRFKTIAFPFRAVYTTLGINDRGEITGASLDDPSALYPRGFHGFLRDRRERFARFDVRQGRDNAYRFERPRTDRRQLLQRFCC
jgi:hypothetical protein